MRKGRRKTKHPKTKPDEYYSIGPFEFARFGKVMISRSSASQEQVRIMQEKMAEEFPKIVSEIDKLVRKIADQVSRLPPDQLLLRAWWEFAAISIRQNRNNVSDSDQSDALRMVTYLQSVIVSVSPIEPYIAEVNDEIWESIKKDVQDLFMRLSLEYQQCLTAHSKTIDPDIDMDVEELRFLTEVFWMNVRGKRYHPHESKALIEILKPHSDVLVRLFDIDTPTLVGELEKILNKLTFGLNDLFSKLQQFLEETLQRLKHLDKASSESDDELLDKVFADEDLARRRDEIFGELVGVELFDVEKITNLPKRLIEELAWSPGEEKEFFSPGEFCGWPLRVWPTMKRPFIRLDERVLCFDVFSLFDNFYRVLQRTIFRLDPSYKNEWNDRQKAISEELPFIYLAQLLPDACIFQSVFYPWKTRSGPGKDWTEVDGLLIYDDHLFVLEVRAGAFTYTSPATDLKAHKESLKNLLSKPASQGNRFVDYLESALEVPIFDKNHSEIGQLRCSDFRNITICAITLDPFTELAARFQHFKKVDVEVGQRSVWALSIDDLRVYADLFDNPMVFLHFVEQRMRSVISEDVHLFDELDHIGLYLAKNNYAQFAHELISGKNQPVKLNLTGYRTPIDKYYEAIIQGEQATPPKQSMPQRIEEIVYFLSKSNMKGRSEAASFLLDASGDLRERLSEVINQQLQKNLELGRPFPCSIYDDFCLTLYSWSPSVPRQPSLALDHTHSVMIAGHEDDRPLLELEYSNEGVLTFVHWQHVRLEGLSDHELARLRSESIRLRKNRLSDIQSQRKIQVNEKCPCGSGKKFKKCCRP